MEKSKLEKVRQEKYIGVIIRNNLSWLLHPKMISCGANLNMTFLQAIIEHVIEILNFSVGRPTL